LEKSSEKSISSVKGGVAWIKTTHEEIIVPEGDDIIDNTLLPDFRFKAADKLFAGIEMQHFQLMKNNNAWQVSLQCSMLRSSGDLATGIKLSLGLVLN